MPKMSAKTGDFERIALQSGVGFATRSTTSTSTTPRCPLQPQAELFTKAVKSDTPQLDRNDVER
jgi:hypothetical protein